MDFDVAFSKMEKIPVYLILLLDGIDQIQVSDWIVFQHLFSIYTSSVIVPLLYRQINLSFPRGNDDAKSKLTISYLQYVIDF